MLAQCQEKNDMRVEKVATTSRLRTALHTPLRTRCTPKNESMPLRSDRRLIDTQPIIDNEPPTNTACADKGVPRPQSSHAPRARSSAFDDIQRKARQACLFVTRLHIETGQVHRPDHLIE